MVHERVINAHAAQPMSFLINLLKSPLWMTSLFTVCDDLFPKLFGFVCGICITRFKKFFLLDLGFNLIDLCLYPIYFMDLEFDSDFWDLLVRYFLFLFLSNFVIWIKYCPNNFRPITRSSGWSTTGPRLPHLTWASWVMVLPSTKTHPTYKYPYLQWNKIK